MPFLPDIVQCTYIEVAPDIVYRTLTTAEGWDAWFTQGTLLDGTSIQLRWKDFGPNYMTAEDGGPILHAVSPARFAFEWSPGRRPTTVRISIEPRGPGTVVTLRETGHTSEDAETHVSCATGWGEALTLLKFYLEFGHVYRKVPPP
ncbi:MAG TPA: SRPBCC domain-containing protein [Candidatus Xenobia bacterium]|jgi:uncharacterized protein YndB with AHSA1/START domain